MEGKAVWKGAGAAFGHDVWNFERESKSRI